MKIVNPLTKIKNQFTDVIFITFVAAIFLIQARLDPDVHHDGIAFTAALANSTGLKPNLDYFSQYGPVAPIVQGLFLDIFGARLIVLRILTALMLTIIALLTLKSIQVKAGHKIAYLIVIYWVLSAPTYLLPTNTPWASVFTTLLGLIILNLSQKPKISWFTIMLLVAVGTLCRVQFILIGVILLLGTIIRNGKNRPKNEIYRAASITIAIFGLSMQLSGILLPYVRENLIWSFITYSPNPIGFDKASLLKLTGLFWIPIFTFLFWRAIRRDFGVEVHGTRGFYRYLFLISLIFLNIAMFFHEVDPENRSFHNPIYIVKFLAQIISFSGVFALTGFFTVAILKKLRQSWSKSITNAQLIQISVGLTTLVQLYPQWDEMHIWWLSPIFAVLVFYFKPFKVKSISSMLTILILIAGFQFMSNIFQERVKFRDEILSGMVGTKASVSGLGTTLENLETYFKTREYEFDCDNAIYAGAGGRYLSELHSYVNWGPKSGTSNTFKPRGIFVCNLSYTEAIKQRDSSNFKFAKILKSNSGSWNLIMMDPD